MEAKIAVYMHGRLNVGETIAMVQSSCLRPNGLRRDAMIYIT